LPSIHPHPVENGVEYASEPLAAFVNRKNVPIEKRDSIKPFFFDPNTADSIELKKLGLSAASILAILRYRAKGGFFKEAAELSKIYSLSHSDYARLKPYIQIEKKKRNAIFSGHQSKLDVNLASLEEWMKMPFIGEKRANQIIRFRTALGGFRSLDQLREVYLLPDSVYERILPKLIISQNETTAIDINTANFDLLNNHPYISSKQANQILRYREEHGKFLTLDDMEKILPLRSDTSWLRKIRPYLKTDI
jgi:DNA uptake protein ComE-like DNA-binding protein